MRKFTIDQFIKLEKRETYMWSNSGYNDDCRIPDLIDVNGNKVIPYEADPNETYFIVKPIGFLGKCKRTKYATVEKIGYTQPYRQKDLERAVSNRLQYLLNLTDTIVYTYYI